VAVALRRVRRSGSVHATQPARALPVQQPQQGNAPAFVIGHRVNVIQAEGAAVGEALQHVGAKLAKLAQGQVGRPGGARAGLQQVSLAGACRSVQQQVRAEVAQGGERLAVRAGEKAVEARRLAQLDGKRQLLALHSTTGGAGSAAGGSAVTGAPLR
jgi:hypothetical protein